MRERGSLEYDKFAYNIFQFCNYVNHYSQKIDDKTFTTMVKRFNDMYNDILNATDNIYKNYLAIEER